MNLLKIELQKQDIPQMVSTIASEVANGTVNPLQALALLKMYETIVTTARKEIMEAAIRERAKYGKEEANVMGYKITEMEAGVTYDYSGCGDIKWETWDSQMRSAADSRKEREAFLRMLKSPLTLVNEQTGEVYTVHPPVKKSTTTLKFI